MNFYIDRGLHYSVLEFVLDHASTNLMFLEALEVELVSAVGQPQQSGLSGHYGVKRR